MSTLNRSDIENVFRSFEARDLEAVMASFADDALVYDPHYPVPEMKGKAAIRQGFTWGLDNIAKPGFAIRHCWIDDDCAALQVDTHHTFKNGMELKFPQVFVLEFQNGLVTRLQAYEPYPPPGIGGLISTLTRWVWKLQGKI